MKRHSMDVVSLLFGLVFGAVAAVYLAAPSLDWDVAGPWVFPVVLIALGVAAIVGAVSGLRNGGDADSVVPAEVSDTADADR